MSLPCTRNGLTHPMGNQQFEVEFPPDYFGRRELETPDKGWLEVVVLFADGRRYVLSFYDPIRLQQTITDALEDRHVFIEPGLVVVDEVNTDQSYRCRVGSFRRTESTEREVMSKSLTQLRDECYHNSKDHGFHDSPKSVGDDIALMHSELSEALEDYRSGHSPMEVWYETKEGDVETIPPLVNHQYFKPCGIPSELADVIIRVLDFSGKYNIDIESAVLEKMEYNKTRPYKHGKKL